MNNFIHSTCKADAIYCVKEEAMKCENCHEYIYDIDELIANNSIIMKGDNEVSSSSMVRENLS